jgi:hypothetical protein
MEASPPTVRVIARRTTVALLVGVVAAAGGVGMGHALADTAGRPANLAVPAPKVHDYAAGLPQFQTISQSFTAANFATKFLLCPAATPHVVGGGAQASSPNNAVLNKSFPLSGPVPADGWAAAAYAPYGSQVNLVIYAICTG